MSTFLLRSARDSLAIRFTVRITLKIKRIVPMTKMVASERILLRQILCRLKDKARLKSNRFEVEVFIHQIISQHLPFRKCFLLRLRFSAF